MELEQEKFNSIKELSEIQTSISEGRGILSTLKADTDKYLELREGMAVERVAKVLSESREALKNTTKNHEELKSYGNELKSFSLSLRGFSNDIVALIQGLRDGTDTVLKTIDQLLWKISEMKGEIKRQGDELEADRKQIAFERNQVDSDWRELRDRQATFLKGVKELQATKVKI